DPAKQGSRGTDRRRFKSKTSHGVPLTIRGKRPEQLDRLKIVARSLLHADAYVIEGIAPAESDEVRDFAVLGLAGLDVAVAVPPGEPAFHLTDVFGLLQECQHARPTGDQRADEQPRDRIPKQGRHDGFSPVSEQWKFPPSPSSCR